MLNFIIVSGCSSLCRSNPPLRINCVSSSNCRVSQWIWRHTIDVIRIVIASSVNTLLRLLLLWWWYLRLFLLDIVIVVIIDIIFLSITITIGILLLLIVPIAILLLIPYPIIWLLHHIHEIDLCTCCSLSIFLCDIHIIKFLQIWQCFDHYFSVELYIRAWVITQPQHFELREVT